MKEFILYLILVTFYFLIGAWSICNAVVAFKRNRYFLFGIEIMIAIVEVVNVAKIVLM